ncbi:PAS domain-containing sensor histidine kinase [Methanobacterium petrolearium]|uniref:PAS domain-containing sensor histidine kinase n=1 Tax=Methanobacterium petrolearium TaxID=710190 RepID=UPI001AE3CF19|nr:histidine kinase dimerization/phosphoacceptor domain -containing protein [Methanobacterium petrolearium]MBP1945080.1 PAS domain S-box-containing protein [Methanobacterium petrolearium]BDZ70997.1 hypothetical protein GCM10025861_15140 [Methanobacterium petrolearium]
MSSKNKSREVLGNELERLKEDYIELNSGLKIEKEYDGQLVINERFLSQIVMEFVEIPLEMDIYDFLAEKLKGLFKDAIILVSAYDEDSDSFRICSISGQRKTVEELSQKVLGRSMFGLNIPRSINYGLFLTGHLNKMDEGLHQLLLGRVSRNICQSIEKSLCLGRIYNIGLSCKGRMYGAVDIGLKKGTKIENKEFIEVLVKMAAVVIERRRAETKILENEAKYRSYVDNAPYGIIVTDENGRYLEVNEMVSDITGYSKEELFKMGIPGLVPLKYLEGVTKELLNSQLTEQAALEFKFLHKNGQTRNGTIKCVKLPKKKYLGFLTDVTQRMKAEEDLKLSKFCLENAISLANLANWEFDIFKRSFTFNDRFYTMCGTTAEEEGGYLLSVDDYIKEFVHPDDAQIVEDAITKSDTNLEYRIIRRDGETRYIVSNVKFVKGEEGNLINVYGTNQDITNIKETQKKLEIALEEKEMLIKEIHHRVKNNLMVISSLLNLQSQHIEDEDVLSVFRESENRAKSMALIHESLYRSTDLKQIDFGDYIRSLTKNLFYTYVPDPNRIKLNLKVEDLMIDINTAVPLGLIVNEIVTNSMKYAFPGDETGEITVEFYPENETLILRVADDGIGLPDDLDLEKISSLGLQIVNNLTHQIDGEIEVGGTNGAEIKIKFKEFEKK